MHLVNWWALIAIIHMTLVKLIHKPLNYWLRNVQAFIAHPYDEDHDTGRWGVWNCHNSQSYFLADASCILKRISDIFALLRCSVTTVAFFFSVLVHSSNFAHLWFWWRGCTGMVALAWLRWHGCTGMTALAWLHWRGCTGMVLLEWFAKKSSILLYKHHGGTA